MLKLIKNRFSLCKNAFVIVTLLCTMNLFNKQLSSLAQERQREAQREGIQDVNLRENEINNVSDLYTQTQAHERLKEMRKLIQDNFGNKVVPYFDIISRMVTKEAELRDTHYVFYHTTATMVAVMADFFTQLYFDAHPEEKAPMNDTFRFLRFQGESRDMSAREFVAEEMRTNFLVDDKDPQKMLILLSVNLSLFGSVGSQTESTWLRFLDNRRSVQKWQQEAFESMMDSFGVNKKHVKEVMALDDILAVTPEALLLQIFIPKKMVDELVYLAWIRGIPATGPMMEWIKQYQSSKAVPEKNEKGEQVRGSLEHIYLSRQALADAFRKEQEKNPIYKKFMQELESGEFSAYAFLKAYCNKPSDLPYLNDTQGRILFTKEGMLNPSSDIEFYYYFSTPREKLEEYSTKLSGVVEKLIAEKKGRPVSPAPVQKQKPVVRQNPVPKPVTPPEQKPTSARAQKPMLIRR